MTLGVLSANRKKRKEQIGKEQTMSDLIKREDAIRKIDEWIQCGSDRDDDIVISEFLSFLKEDILSIPSVHEPQE